MKFEIGTKVILADRYNRETITEISHITPKGFVKVKGSNRLFKSNGLERTSDPQHAYNIRPATNI